jgi:hypothetical protein
MPPLYRTGAAAVLDGWDLQPPARGGDERTRVVGVEPDFGDLLRAPGGELEERHRRIVNDAR